MLSTAAVSYKQHRFPREVIAQVVWLYFRFPLSFRLIVIHGQPYGLWRAVEQNGYILDETLQTRRNTKAARRLLTRLLRKQGARPRRMITDRLKSCGRPAGP